VNGTDAEFLHSATALDNGWQVHVLLDYHALIHALNLQYLGIFLALALATGLAGGLAGLSARRLVQPLERLTRELAGGEHGTVSSLAPLPAGAAQEIALVHEELQRSMRAAAHHREELEQQVTARTRELEQANALLQALASADALTGLGNRRVLEERFPMLRAVAERAKASIAVVVIDLDHFKQLNDRHGHLVGDECLKRVAALMQQEFARRTDLLVRFGGEEFVLAVECPSIEVLHRKLDKLRARIEAMQLAGEDGTAIRVTASFGAVLGAAGHGAELMDWLRLADACLYRAKAAGRNAVIAETLAA
jgi:diguanylate cyclase (GGDEF)-like protein